MGGECVCLDFTPGTEEPLRMQISVTTQLCVHWWKKNTHLCSFFITQAHTHIAHCVCQAQSAGPPGSTKGRTKFNHAIDLRVCLKIECVCVCALTLHVKAHFCLKQPYKYFYLKDYKQLTRLQLESSLVFCAEATQWLLRPQAKSLHHVSETEADMLQPKLRWISALLQEPHLQKSTLVS